MANSDRYAETVGEAEAELAAWDDPAEGERPDQDYMGLDGRPTNDPRLAAIPYEEPLDE